MAQKTQNPLPGNSRYRKWFDDTNLESSSEWSFLIEEIPKTDIKQLLESKDITIRTVALHLNETDRAAQKENINRLATYLKTSQEQKQQEEKSKEDAKTAREAKRGVFSKKVHNVVKVLTRPMVKTFDFLLKVLENTIFIATELTFNTHYQVALKAILLFRTAYIQAGELTEEVKETFEAIQKYVPEMDFMQDAVSTKLMAHAVTKLFTAIMCFVAAAASYLDHGIITKMVLYLGGKNEKFSKLVKAIEGAYTEVSRVRGIAQLAIALESLDKITELREDNRSVVEALETIDNNVTALIQKPDVWAEAAKSQLLALHAQTRFQADLHVQTLRSKLFDEPYEPSHELLFNDYERVFLTPKQRWHRHFRGFPPRSGQSASLIWISGDTGRRNVSWISSFCVDFIHYVREFNNIDVVYAFGKRGRGVRYTPAMIIKGLIAQLLETYPEIATQNIRTLSASRFELGGQQQAGTVELAWVLLLDVLACMGRVHEIRSRQVLILIDRLDLCASNEDFSVSNDLLPRFQKLSHQFPRVRVIITAAKVSAVKVRTLRQGPEWLLAYGKRVNG